MKILMALPSTLPYCPYVEYYMEIMCNTGNKESKPHLIILVEWDRYDSNRGQYVFNDGKSSTRKGIFNHVKYCLFVLRIILQERPLMVILFTAPVIAMLGPVLRIFRQPYVVDIRDYHKAAATPPFRWGVRGASMSVISSPAYKEWLPEYVNYNLSHNLNWIGKMPLSSAKIPVLERCAPIIISCVGALKDISPNIELIDALGNNPNFRLEFVGRGLINEELREFTRGRSYSNVQIIDFYNKVDEPGLYEHADIINMLMSNDNINNKTCLSNRLYNAVQFGRPLIAIQGSLIATIISDYGLGIVVPDLRNIASNIERFKKEFNITEFDAGRQQFIRRVSDDSKSFRNSIEKLLTATEYNRTAK